MSRREVLNLYKRIIKIAKNWKAIQPENTQTEREYIISEARAKFRANKNVILKFPHKLLCDFQKPPKIF